MSRVIYSPQIGNDRLVRIAAVVPDISATRGGRHSARPKSNQEIDHPIGSLEVCRSNNQLFGSPHEWDWRETQLRFAGDLKGLLTKLDYIQGYSPLDFSVLDPHWGPIDDWENFVDTVHQRGIAPFRLSEYLALYKTLNYLPWGLEQYANFSVIMATTSLTLIVMVTWKPLVSAQTGSVTVDGMTAWATATCACATNLGKKSFYITGEVTGGDTFGSLCMGRDSAPTMLHPSFLQATNLTESENQYFCALYKAWQHHGCYKLGSTRYFNMLLESSLTGCDDDWNLLDHFDPTMDMRRLQKHFMYLRTTYNALQDVLTSYSMEIEPSLSSSRVRTTLHLKWASGLYHVR
ncbi:glycoside hydrolase family 13 protein, partial [Suillus luteus UH-Slu-Lm8-n1]